MRSSLRRSPIVSLARILVGVAVLSVSVVIPTTPALAADTFVLTGRGYGHGIGMSQWGAKGYAEKGLTFDQILTHFYQKTTVPARSGMSAKTVSVNLDPDANSTNGGYTLTAWTLSPAHSGGRLVVNGILLQPEATYQFTPVGSSVKVRNVSTNASLTVAGYASVTESGTSTSLIEVAQGTGVYDRLGQRYRGVLRVTPNNSATAPRVKLANILPLDSYLYGVVPAESPSAWPAEALKAQAVAARSYAYTTLWNGETGQALANEMYCDTRHQAYLGYDGEAATTNAAVRATSDRVVYFDGTYANGTSHKEVVRTFFSSSSGGRTASIQDVWTGAAPKPYYTTVADADIGSGSSLAASWGAAKTYTGATLAAALRAKGSSTYIRPYPAIVTAVAIQRPVSGFAKYVTFTWSDGRKTTPTGDWVRGRLGLRSTKFWITRVSGIARIEQTHTKVRWTGSWKAGTGSQHSGRSYKWSSRRGSTSAISFKGSGIAIIGPKTPSYGRANVYVDGRYRATISAYALRTAYRQRLFALSGLSADTTHTVSIKVTGTKVRASRGVMVGVDAFDITGGSIQ